MVTDKCSKKTKLFQKVQITKKEKEKKTNKKLYILMKQGWLSRPIDCSHGMVQSLS